MEAKVEAVETLTMRTLYRAIVELEIDDEVDSVRMQSSVDPYIIVERGSSAVFIRHLNDSDEENDVDQAFEEGDLVELWSMVVTDLKNLSEQTKLAIYDFIGSRTYRVGAPTIDSEGTLVLSSTLPTENLTPEYGARYIAEFIDFIDRIDSEIAKTWDGLTAIDEGPERDQGSANHAQY